ncbi:hypothetical protein CEXT_180411 [Caerostris extrusa]|uniref:Uncharacterized protein n=1 Tax=Caerostris extrusa TaxID=172846 RepID=A0AAV4NU00_CAEEX|nr:hypothetical protein CEXT_180411 [Caerostris extrusa]
MQPIQEKEPYYEDELVKELEDLRNIPASEREQTPSAVKQAKITTSPVEIPVAPVEVTTNQTEISASSTEGFASQTETPDISSERLSNTYPKRMENRINPMKINEFAIENEKSEIKDNLAREVAELHRLGKMMKKY